MRFLILGIFFVGCSAQYVGRIYRRDADVKDNWYNVDDELDHGDTDSSGHFSIDLHMDFPQKFPQENKMAPIVKNPMWIDKLAVINAPPMCDCGQCDVCRQNDVEQKDVEEYDQIPINYRTAFSDRELYQISKSRQRRSTQQVNNKKTTRQSEKKSKFKTWLEGKKLGEKFTEKLGKMKKTSPSRQARSVDMDIALDDNKDNRINRQIQCSACSGLNPSCPHCNVNHAPIFFTPIHAPRPQFIEYINGEQMAYVPQHTNYPKDTPRYVYDQLGHKFLERDGYLQIITTPSLDSPIVAIPYNMDYAQMLYETLQRHPHFQTAHKLEDGKLTKDPIKQTQDVLELIKALTQEKNRQKRHIKEYKKDVVEETFVDEDALSDLLMDSDREFEKYLEQIGYTGNVEMFDMQNMDKDGKPISQSIFYSPKKTSKVAPPKKLAQKPFAHLFKPTVSFEQDDDE